MFENQFNLICETINSGILILDKDLNVKFWNRWMEVQTKIKEEDIKDKNLLDFYENINSKILSRKIKTTLRLNSSTFYNSEQINYLFDIKLNKIADSVFYNMQQSITISPFDLEKELVVVYVYDTTLLRETNYKLKKSKKELEEKNDEFQRMINALTEGLIISDEYGNCEIINKYGKELLRLKKNTRIKEKKLLDFVCEKSKDLVKRNLESGDIRTYEVYIKRDDDTYFPAIVSGQVIQLDNKKKRISTIIDISNLKEKDRLITRQAKLADMGQMIANIAHQWRQPLSLISTTASGLKLYEELGKLESQTLNDSLDQIMLTTAHLSQTIDDFKNFIKDDKEKTVFDLNEIIQKDLTLLEGIIKTSHIKIVINRKNEDIIMKGYPNELTQAIVNIITNAKDVLEDRNIEERYIFIELEKINSYGYLRIYDNANGINDDIIDKIFEPYFTTKHKSQGTGLGLFMTHRIIKDSMDGEVVVKNLKFTHKGKEYKGACFTIELPLHKL
ncbi:PAS domain-containing sensor histidine kinase [Arcobacter roscoffensis]|uniref:histidine kinase n=1 Tax=Arcobacter roscoffensis TaxID=2961520 RepID=A0ABY5E4J5_9BACT|nr:ATP-binding protein [Arcobacter roscoffensis]UTJ07079.1 ATP-binding protein [Arcobacter roscoffensis]